MKKRKKYLPLFLSLCITLTACQQAEEEKTEERPETKAVLQVLQQTTAEWDGNLDPYALETPDFLLGFMYEPLVCFDTYSGEVVMWLAEDVTLEEELLTIHLRQDVKWSDGEVFDADDVVFSLEYGRDDPEIGGMSSRFLEVTKVDDYTLRIWMERPYQWNSVLNRCWMMPEHIWAEGGENLVVTGPFSEIMEVSDSKISLGQNPEYWQGENLAVEELHCFFYEEDSEALALLQTGTIDWAALDLPFIEEQYVQKDPDRQYWYGPGDALRLSMNYMTSHEGNRSAFEDVTFKRALSMAVDRRGKEVPTVSGLSTSLLSYQNPQANQWNEAYLLYDPEGAKVMLATGGYVDLDGDGYVETPDGQEIRFQIVSPLGWVDWNVIGQKAAAAFREIGINATAIEKEISAVTTSWAEGDWDMMCSFYGTGSDIYTFYFDSLGDQSRALTASGWSVCQTNYLNDSLSEKIEEIKSAETEAEVRKLAAEVELFVAKELISIPTVYTENKFIYHTGRFTGWSETLEDGQPSLLYHDSKILQLLRLEAVH